MATLEIEKAKEYSKRYLGEKLRLNGDTYFDHCLRSYEYLCESHIKNEVVLQATFLHDVDAAHWQKIKEEFGPEVLSILESYQKLKQITISTEKISNEAYSIQAYVNTSKDFRSLVVRLADKLDNVNTSYVLDKEKRLVTANKMLYFYSNLAKILGLTMFSTKLADLSFKIINPSEYFKIEQVLTQRYSDVDKKLADIKVFLLQILNEQHISADISYRIKSVYSIYKKLERHRAEKKKLSSVYSEIYDIVALRILVDLVEQCYQVENFLKGVLDELPEYRDDYIAKPRPSGYQSLHNIFNLEDDIDFEVQIRTYDMHMFNEYGPASHLLYKLGDKGASSLLHKNLLKYNKEDSHWFKNLDFNELEKKSQEPPKVPFSKYIYIFTPKGDIIELPKGSVLLDFAYHLHTDMGDRCMGGFVNNVYTGLDHILESGDTVKIKMTTKRNVNADWLSIAKSSRARAHIKKALRLD